MFQLYRDFENWFLGVGWGRGTDNEMNSDLPVLDRCQMLASGCRCDASGVKQASTVNDLTHGATFWLYLIKDVIY